ncbi:MAG: type IV pilus twitching motility protein PilT [Planctomycetes bacterium]|nr:type IV pilus twitching motility protein PilT [Planctomycetota bacterium]
MVRLFDLAVQKGGSDILVTAGSPPRIRIHGDLRPVGTKALTPEDVKRWCYAIVHSEQVARFERERELDFSFDYQGKYRFRGNLYFQRGAVGGAFRIISMTIPELEPLNLPPILREFALRPQGLFAVTGPTGHGKSTTLAAMVGIINHQRECHVVTVEDPIEFLHQNIRSIVDQREVGSDTLSFAEALKHVLRQNPDVILVGEMRDPETMSAALTAAETGHLVLTTLHTNDAVQAIDRIVDSFPPHHQSQVRTQLAFSLLAVMSQRLVPRADGKGLHVVVEFLVNTPAVAHLIRDGKLPQVYSMMETGGKEGMVTMDHALKQLALDGVISFEEAKRRMRNPAALTR